MTLSFHIAAIINQYGDREQKSDEKIMNHFSYVDAGRRGVRGHYQDNSGHSPAHMHERKIHWPFDLQCLTLVDSVFVPPVTFYY